MSNCRSCSAEILWAKTKNGKLIPIDPEPGFAGNIVISEGAKGEKFARILKKGDPRPRGDTYRSHFVTCPAAEKHRKPLAARGKPGQIVEHLRNR